MTRQIDHFLGQFIDQKNSLLRKAVDLHNELNAVILADDTLIGADDRATLCELCSTYVQAKQTWYRGIIEALDAGQSVWLSRSSRSSDEESGGQRRGPNPRLPHCERRRAKGSSAWMHADCQNSKR